MSGRNEAGFGDDDRLPWLETVEEDYREGPSIWRILLLIVLALAVLAAVVFGVWWYQKQQGLAGNGALINAQEGDYKVKPDDEGGMKVEGEGGTTFATSEGADVNASVNMNATAEAPVEGKTVTPSPTPTTGTKTATVAIPAAGGEASGSGALVQLGAFPDRQGAEGNWARLAKRFPVIAPLGHSIEQGNKDGKPVFRLRVNAGSNGQAREICAKLKAGGENCYVAN
ncbi:SPOR domain-containing protein [Sphingomonas sp. LB-2]|uniref:SPOR domain-containing protein n=1 Tax=Sphingomonas caeni TaxID=2984949 RepID=UPI0022300A1B|nr:SPOR domain-containing protein [Sphingomonas caeni]MCW3847560.1 SPOR domain-containing protein [Sphingomonas caeni]